MRLSKANTIKAYAYDKNGKLICTIYDSGYSNLDGVLYELRRRAQHRKVVEMSIIDQDTEEYARYKIIGDTIKKKF